MPNIDQQGSFSVPILAQAEQKLEAGLTPQNRVNYLKIVVAGQKVAMQNGPNGLLARLHQQQDPLTAAVQGSINLVFFLRRSSRGTMPPIAMVPAAMSLMFHALDFLNRTGALKVDQNVLWRATNMFTDHIMGAFKIGQNQLNAMAQKAHGISQNPQAVAQLHAKNNQGGGQSNGV